MPVEVLRQLKHLRSAIGLSRLVEHRADKLVFCPVGDSSSISHLLAALQGGAVQPSREERSREVMEKGPLPAAKEEAYRPTSQGSIIIYRPCGVSQQQGNDSSHKNNKEEKETIPVLCRQAVPVHRCHEV